MKKLATYKLGHPNFYSHMVRVIKTDGHDDYITVVWGDDEEIVINTDFALNQHSFIAALDFNGIDEQQYTFATNLFQARVYESPMFCLQVICGKKDKFLWLPRTKSNYKRILELLNTFSSSVLSAIHKNGLDFKLKTIVNVAKDQLPHFEELNYLEMPEELESFENEPPLEDISYFLVDHNRNSENICVVVVDPNLIIPQPLNTPTEVAPVKRRVNNNLKVT